MATLFICPSDILSHEESSLSPKPIFLSHSEAFSLLRVSSFLDRGLIRAKSGFSPFCFWAAMETFSSVVMVGNSLMSCHALPMPSHASLSGVKWSKGLSSFHHGFGNPKISLLPFMLICSSPMSGSRFPVRMFNRVVFPEPFSPLKSTTSPCLSSREILSRTT